MESWRFVAFAAVSALALIGGYAARRRQLVDERLSRPVHLHTVIWIWSSVSVVSFWGIAINAQLLIVMAIQPLTMLLAWALASAAARLRRMPARQTGPLVLAAALSNQGFTLGAYLCYTILEPGQTAMGYAVAYVTSMQIFIVLIFYPVARHYELLARRTDRRDADERLPSLPRLIVGSFLDVRAMPMYAAAAGAVLSLTTAGVPAWIDKSHAIDIACFAGAIGSYFGIGLRLRLGDWRDHLPHHAIVALIKFLAMPALAATLVCVLPAAGLGIGPLARDVVVICAFMPSAIACVIVSNLFHLDARLASILWLINTATFLVIALPVLLVVFPGG